MLQVENLHDNFHIFVLTLMWTEAIESINAALI